MEEGGFFRISSGCRSGNYSLLMSLSVTDKKGINEAGSDDVFSTMSWDSLLFVRERAIIKEMRKSMFYVVEKIKVTS